MKAIVYDSIQKVQCRKVPDPKIEKDDDIIVKVTSTAICGSDLHLVHGLVKGMYDGFVLGHETMGCVIDCVGVDGKMSLFEKVETVLKLQGESKSAIEIASQAVRKCGHVALVGVYGTKYNNFPLGNMFTRNITLKMGQCPATRYVEPILEMIKKGEFDATDIITHTLPLEKGRHAYEIFDAKEDNCIKVVLKP